MAWAQALTSGSRTYITPFPQGDRYQAYIFGDSLGQGLGQGLQEAFKSDSNIKINDSAKPSSGLARPEYTDWADEIERLTQAQPVHIAVIMLGLNDVRTIRTSEGSVRWGADGWREAYGKQIERLIKKLKAANIAVYWVGMPVMSSSHTNEAMQVMNEVFREKTYLSGVKFIDTWNGFTDQFGEYSPYGPDLTGQPKRLRESDGVHFTAAGARKLAHYVEVVMRRDLAAARSERNLPLAGDEDEQTRISPLPKSQPGAGAAAPGEKPQAGKPAVAPAGDPGKNPARPGGEPAKAPPSATAAKPDEKVQAGKRAALQQAQPAPGSVQEANAAKPGAAPSPPHMSGANPGYSPAGELIAGDKDSGVTALASVSPANELSLKAGQRRAPEAEKLYYRALIGGEALKPKTGRADDFSWPPPPR